MRSNIKYLLTNAKHNLPTAKNNNSGTRPLFHLQYNAHTGGKALTLIPILILDSFRLTFLCNDR
jgi:hypothetical protein